MFNYPGKASIFIVSCRITLLNMFNLNNFNTFYLTLNVDNKKQLFTFVGVNWRLKKCCHQEKTFKMLTDYECKTTKNIGGFFISYLEQ